MTFTVEGSIGAVQPATETGVVEGAQRYEVELEAAFEGEGPGRCGSSF